MTTWSQDYPALPGSADAAAHYARAVVAEHLPGRADRAPRLLKEMFAVGLARSTPHSSMNLITLIAEHGKAKIRFELHYANDLDAPDPPAAHQMVSALSNAYGEHDTRSGKLIYAELWEQPS